MSQREETLSEIWLWAIEKNSGALDKALDKTPLTPQEGANLWGTFFRQSWIPGLEVLHQHHVPGCDALHEIPLNQVEHALLSFHWATLHFGWSCSEELVDKLWVSHFFLQKPLPQDERLIEDFPLPSRFWEKALERELVDSCSSYNPRVNSGWSVCWTQKFTYLPFEEQAEILSRLEAIAEEHLWGESFDAYKVKREAFLAEQESCHLNQVLPHSDITNSKVRI